MAEVRPRVLMMSLRADIGGGPEHVYRLVSGLRHRCELFVACPDEPPYWPRFSELVGPERMLALRKRRVTMTGVRALRQFIARHSIDLVHSHGHGAGIHAHLLMHRGARVVHSHHGLHFAEPTGSFTARALVRVQRVLERSHAMTIYVSGDEMRAAQALGLAQGPSIVIANGVAVPETPVAHGDRAGPLRVVTVTRYNAQKNPEGLFEIIRALRALAGPSGPEVHIFGDGDGRRAFEKRLRGEGLEAGVHIHGSVDDLAGRLDQFDALLSCSRWEGLPLVVLEAMAAGLPVVLSRVAGHKELLAHGLEPFGFELADPGRAAYGLVKLQDPALRQTVGDTARGIVRAQFSLQQMLERTEACYRNLLVTGESRHVAA